MNTTASEFKSKIVVTRQIKPGRLSIQIEEQSLVASFCGQKTHTARAIAPILSLSPWDEKVFFRKIEGGEKHIRLQRVFTCGMLVLIRQTVAVFKKEHSND